MYIINLHIAQQICTMYLTVAQAPPHTVTSQRYPLFHQCNCPFTTSHGRPHWTAPASASSLPASQPTASGSRQGTSYAYALCILQGGACAYQGTAHSPVHQPSAAGRPLCHATRAGHLRAYLSRVPDLRSVSQPGYCPPHQRLANLHSSNWHAVFSSLSAWYTVSILLVAAGMSQLVTCNWPIAF